MRGGDQIPRGVSTGQTHSPRHIRGGDQISRGSKYRTNTVLDTSGAGIRYLGGVNTGQIHSPRPIRGGDQISRESKYRTNTES
jgi:hypothetical protein